MDGGRDMIALRAQWLRGKVSDSRLVGSNPVLLKQWASFIHYTLFQFTQLYK